MSLFFFFKLCRNLEILNFTSLLKTNQLAEDFLKHRCYQSFVTNWSTFHCADSFQHIWLELKGADEAWAETAAHAVCKHANSKNAARQAELHRPWYVMRPVAAVTLSDWSLFSCLANKTLRWCCDSVGHTQKKSNNVQIISTDYPVGRTPRYARLCLLVCLFLPIWGKSVFLSLRVFKIWISKCFWCWNSNQLLPKSKTKTNNVPNHKFRL